MAKYKKKIQKFCDHNKENQPSTNLMAQNNQFLAVIGNITGRK